MVDDTSSQDKRETELQDGIDQLHGNERDVVGYSTSEKYELELDLSYLPGQVEIIPCNTYLIPILNAV